MDNVRYAALTASLPHDCQDLCVNDRRVRVFVIGMIILTSHFSLLIANNRVSIDKGVNVILMTS